MIENEFVVPDRTEDLCEISSSQYVVNDVLSVRDLSAEIKTFRDLLNAEGDDFIFKHFDVFYSLLRQFAEVDENIKLEAYEILLEVAKSLTNELPEILENNEELSDSEVRFKYRNLIKMTVYMLCQLAEAYESELLKPSIVVSDIKKGRKKKKTTCDFGWDTIRSEFVSHLVKLYKLPMYKLWEPPIIEHEFVNIVSLSFFKLVENPEVLRKNVLCDEIFDFLGYSLKAHNTDLGYSIKITQLIQDHQHLASGLAKAVHIFVSRYKTKNIVTELFKEIGGLDTEDMLRDTNRIHQISQFLVEVTEKCTDEAIGAFEFIRPMLEEESHIMRNCVISMIGEIVSKLSSCDDLPKERMDMRDQLIDTLLNHVLDVNSFVRCKALQVAKRLIDDGSMPLFMQLQFLERSSGRLKDKTCIVRKNALQFLKTFLISNPFAAQLPVDELRNSYSKEREKLAEMVPEEKKSTSKKAVVFDSDDEHSETENDENQATGDSAEPQCNGESMDVVANENEVISSSGDKPSEAETNSPKFSDEDIAKQRVLVEYLKLTLQSAESVIASMPWVCDMLKSATVTDVLEAIDYVATAFQLGLREAVIGIKEMMRLIFSKEPVVKSSVVAAYKKLYLTTKEGEDENVAASLVSQNLILFLRDATENEVLAIEEFIKEFVKTGDISKRVLDILWKTFEMSNENTTEEESLSSLVLLSMAGGADPDVITRNISRLVSTGLGARANKDYQLVKLTCAALMRIDNSCKGLSYIESKVPQFRLAVNHVLFARLLQLMINGIDNNEDNRWCPMIEKSVALIFKLSGKPEEACKVLIQEIARKIHSGAENSKGMHLKMMIVRFLFLCGHVVLYYMIYLETDVLMEMKRQEYLKEQVEKLQKAKLEAEAEAQASFEKDQGNDESSGGIEFQGAEAEDIISELIIRVCNEELLCGKNFLAILYRVVVFACKLMLKNFDPMICGAASLSLAKFMMVSATTCDGNLQIMMTLLEKAPLETIRSNIIIAMGDLMVRFPNEVQPWAPNLYKRLRDESSVVRLNTLVVLTHLILHDLIKVKGQISDIALCMVDQSEEVVNVVKFLFKELSKKKNTLYNLLPDIISGLSEDKNEVSEENFQIIIKYVFQFIEKEREVEGLVEKLCIRLKDADSPCQLHKMIFSLSLFSMTEKCVRKLIEHKECFKGRSDDEMFVKYIKDIIANAKKHSSKLEQEIILFTEEIGIC